MGVDELGAHIEKGNDGLSILALIMEIVITVSAIIGMLSVGDIVFSPIHYVINVYLLFFAAVGCILEGPESTIEKFPVLQKAQGFVFEFAKFLTELWGRGVFYVFQASLAMCHTNPLFFIVGLLMFLVGVLTIMSQFAPENTKKVVKIGVSQLKGATGPYAAKYEPAPTNAPVAPY